MVLCEVMSGSLSSVLAGQGVFGRLGGGGYNILAPSKGGLVAASLTIGLLITL